MDFTAAHLKTKQRKSHEDVKVEDCIFVLEWLEGDKRQRINIDFLCDCSDSNKNDYHFLLHATLKLFIDYSINDRFDILLVWSNGGAHHFKTRFCQWMWHWLSTHRFSNKPIIHNFFASYHGHSLADAHAATIKRALRSQYHASQLQRFSPNTIALYWGPADASDYAALLSHACPSTRIHVFPHIDRDPLLKPKCSAVPEIKKQHCFVYANGQCAMAAESGAPGSRPFSFTLQEH
jgi:hypothetical protein